MRKLFKWTFRIVLLLIVLVVLAAVFRNHIIKFITEWQLREETGMHASIGKIQVGIRSPFIKIENLRLKNTREFGGATFINIPEIYLEYDRDALVAGKFHATVARFNMSDVNIVRNLAGQTNVYVLAEHMDKVHRKKHRKVPDFNAIDTLTLTLGKARYFDMKNPTNNFEFNFLLQNETVKNVKSEKDLNGIILLAVIRNTLAMSGTRGNSFSSFIQDPQRTIDSAKQVIDLLIPPKKAKKTNEFGTQELRKKN
jgi:hypothetical protein